MTLLSISNWKVLVEQFGLDDAKSIHKRLRVEYEKEGRRAVLTCECYKDSEAICTFDFDYQEGSTPYYLYTGTAS